MTCPHNHSLHQQLFILSAHHSAEISVSFLYTVTPQFNCCRHNLDSFAEQNIPPHVQVPARMLRTPIQTGHVTVTEKICFMGTACAALIPQMHFFMTVSKENKQAFQWYKTYWQEALLQQRNN